MFNLVARYTYTSIYLIYKPDSYYMFSMFPKQTIGKRRNIFLKIYDFPAKLLW